MSAGGPTLQLVLSASPSPSCTTRTPELPQTLASRCRGLFPLPPPRRPTASSSGSSLSSRSHWMDHPSLHELPHSPQSEADTSCSPMVAQGIPAMMLRISNTGCACRSGDRLQYSCRFASFLRQARSRRHAIRRLALPALFANTPCSTIRFVLAARCMRRASCRVAPSKPATDTQGTKSTTKVSTSMLTAHAPSWTHPAPATMQARLSSFQANEDHQLPPSGLRCTAATHGAPTHGGHSMSLSLSSSPEHSRYTSGLCTTMA